MSSGGAGGAATSGSRVSYTDGNACCGMEDRREDEVIGYVAVVC